MFFIQHLLTSGGMDLNSSGHPVYDPVKTQTVCRCLISLAAYHILITGYSSCSSRHWDTIPKINDLSRKQLLLVHCFKECHLIIAGKGKVAIVTFSREVGACGVTCSLFHEMQSRGQDQKQVWYLILKDHTSWSMFDSQILYSQSATASHSNTAIWSPYTLTHMPVRNL